MRDIHCRGRNSETGEWEIGYMVIREQDVHGTLKYFLQQFGGRWLPVDEKTIGQYTGLQSVDGTRVYEGDILDYPGESAGPLRSVVVWDKAAAGFTLDIHGREYGSGWAKMQMVQMMQVVGNIHDKETVK